ncbi:hypothetical protein BP5796_12181 [Coleophoma crateriformis]|uniref:Uncharacterized protein n=1 Tax=Coleophoma crateriformis TaxID=565419 RepID=A0A3D8QC22_9HELO|nr:hypothetical protein BP5796_12181 [Coleophoma crateriformis]
MLSYWNSSNVFALAVGLVTAKLLYSLVVLPILYRIKARSLGCGLAPTEPTKWPLGLDMVVRGIRASREQRVMEFVLERFENMGCHTWYMNLLGSSNLLTADPKNIQALLATQFDDFRTGAPKVMSLKQMIGRSIFIADGEAWHNTRVLMRPLFSRENVSDLRVFEGHFQTMLKCLLQPGTEVDKSGRKWTKKASLASFFPCFTIDSATEIFVGRSVDSLEARLEEVLQESSTLPREKDENIAVKKDFAWAFNRSLQIANTRLRLRSFYYFYGRKELKECKRVLYEFINSNIDAADLARDQGQVRVKYDFINTLRSRCPDRTEIPEQIAGLLAAGRDSTASLMGFVFYLMIRNPRVFEKLRKVVRETFGPADKDAPNRITFETLRSCKYLQNVMNEALRMNSVVPFNSKCAIRDTTLPTGGGPDGTKPIFIRKGTEIAYSTYVLHRRKDLWGPDTDEFRPERWDEKRRLPWQYAPFSGGPRICIGQQFALTEVGYVIVRLLQCFDGIEGLDLDGTKRDWLRFSIIVTPGTPNPKEKAVPCKLRLAPELDC